MVLEKWTFKLDVAMFPFLEVVVTQLVERSLSIPEVRGSNPVIGKNLFIH